jgi:hypothetical protein
LDVEVGTNGLINSNGDVESGAAVERRKKEEQEKEQNTNDR